MNVLVSVVVAIYNTRSQLSRCIESILEQTYTHFELILVNDGSTDESGEICDSYRIKDGRVKVINKKNGGLTSARKAGYDASSGEYVCFIDSDDYLEKQYISKQVESITCEDADLSICSYWYVNGDAKREIHFPFIKKVYYRNDFADELIKPRVYRADDDRTCIPDFLWLRLFRRELITDRCFVSEREVYTEDIFFNIEYMKKCKKICILDECLYFYCFNNTSLTNRYRENRLNMELNRVGLLETYMSEYGCYEKERIVMAVFKGVWGCVENASYLPEYIAFKKEIVRLLSNRSVKEAINGIRSEKLTLGEKIVLYGCRFHMVYFLYLYKKIMNSLK